MQYKLPDIRQVDVKGKRVFLRSDLDAPLKESRIPASTRGEQNSEFRMEVEDDTRLVASLPTLQYLLDSGAKVVLAGHLRRPEGYDPKLSLLPVAEWLAKEFRIPASQRGEQNSEFRIEKLGEFDGWRLSESLFLLENLRFYKEEKANDPEFVKKLASLADIYVNDAFASSHRSHSSITGVPSLLPKYAGIRLQKEIEVLSRVLENPKRPLTVIIGGAKIETKLPLVEKMHKIADYVLIGGKIAQETRILLQVQHEKVEIPSAGKKSVLLVADLTDNQADITLKSAENFSQIIGVSQMVVWNGPLGQTEGENASEINGSRIIVNSIIENKVYSIAGGGDTLEFLKKLGFLDKFGFFSTGGGAMLSFLSGETLPGVEALFSS